MELPKLNRFRMAFCMGVFVLSAFQQASAQSASCAYSVTNEWNNGLTGSITITNTSNVAINGWSVNWQYSANRVTSSWNANVTGSNPYAAMNLAWNGSIQPGQSISFGVQVDKNGGSAEKPTINGAICNASTTSSVVAVSSNATTSAQVISSRSSSLVASSLSSATNSIVNLALLATASTSYVSSWETLAAVNDNSTPANSNDKSKGAYGNWNNPNSYQWVEYQWNNPVTISSSEIYWFDDAGGVLTPTTAVLEYFNGSSWIAIGNVPVVINRFNTLTVPSVTTNRVRVRMINTQQSTGILEWRVLGANQNGTVSSQASSINSTASSALVSSSRSSISSAVISSSRSSIASSLVPSSIAASSVSSSSVRSSSSSSVVPQACVAPKADNVWAGSTCSTPPANNCVAGNWVAPKDGGENGAPLRLESEHFAVYWKDGTNITTANAQTALTTLEGIWESYFGAPIYFPQPYCNSAQKYKAAIHFDNEFPLWGGGWSRNGVNYMGMWVGPGAANDPWGLAHEFMHGVQAMTQGFGDCGGVGCWIYESHANWMPHQLFDNNVHCSEMLVNAPHLYYGNTRNRYCNWQFFEFVKDKYCHSAINNMWTYNAPAGQRDPWQKLMLSQNWSIEQLNDRFGEWAMHNITWDYKNPDGSDQGAVYRQNYGNINADAGNYTARRLRLTQLESLDANFAQNRRFVSPYYWAPQRWGYNAVQLFPEAGATSIKVSFRGVVQNGANSGWRWGLVSTNSNMTQARYTELQRGSDGELNLCVTPGENVFLVVTATPTAYQKITWDNPSDGKAYPSIYRYPYMVEVQGAWPQGFKNGVRDACPSGTVRHSNGGGCAPSGTPSTVYVGPYAKIVGGNVSGNARIENQATVVNGTVSGGTVGALSLIGVASHPHHGASSFNVSGSAKVLSTFYPMGWFGSNQSASGTATLMGDLEFVASGKSSNTFYGFVANDWNGVSSATEVTVAPPYVWRP
ncbi:MAG: DUF6055 domain-containing protein [Cellvibrio sp.]|uniref:DUF6055 domain-containing protein n=1 Tax=Cellvibrio sp. TaxID=1965322 RepID=UPI0031B3D91D